MHPDAWASSNTRQASQVCICKEAKALGKLVGNASWQVTQQWRNKAHQRVEKKTHKAVQFEQHRTHAASLDKFLMKEKIREQYPLVAQASSLFAYFRGKQGTV
jgi:hypothetical protein